MRQSPVARPVHYGCAGYGRADANGMLFAGPAERQADFVVFWGIAPCSSSNYCLCF